MKLRSLYLLVAIESAKASVIRGSSGAVAAPLEDASFATSASDTAATVAAAVDNVNNEQQEEEKQRNLQTETYTPPTCDATLWRPNHNLDWSTGYCSQNGNCNWKGHSSELACCKAVYGGQTSGTCVKRLPNPPTTSPTKAGGMDEYYPDYNTDWSAASCKNDYPLPNGIRTYGSLLECCKGAYAGQASGACLASLPSPPTTSPTSVNGAEIYYPVYENQWSDGYCSNDLPLPFTSGGRPTYATQLECCKSAYGGQTSGKCLGMLPSPPTTSPTEVGGAEFYYPMYEVPYAEGYCSNARPLPFTTGGRPTYDTQLECCKKVYASQSSGVCLGALPSPPTTSPTALEGPWYADRSQSASSATCSNAYPTNTNEGTYDTQEQCCKAVYNFQSSDACLCDVDPCHSCKCYGIASAKQKIIDKVVAYAIANFGSSPATTTLEELGLVNNEFFYKMYCTNPDVLPSPLTQADITGAGGGTNPDLTFNECCNSWSGTDDACMCTSEPCYSCQCRDTVAETNLESLSPGAPSDPNEYDFHEYCIGNDVGGDTIPTWVKNSNLPECYDSPTKQPTPSPTTRQPTARRRLGANEPASE